MSERLSAVIERRIALTLSRRLSASEPVRVGIDLVEIDPFRAKCEGNDDLVSQLFTSAELDYAVSRKRPWLHLAARFAAKEALFKALGTGLTDGLSWLDVEVTRDEAGEPGLALSGGAARRAEAMGFRRFAVSLSHGRQYAVAVVLAVEP